MDKRDSLFGDDFGDDLGDDPVIHLPSVRKPQFVARFDFDAEQRDELSLRVGDRMTGVEQVDENWWIVQSNGSNERGLVPSNVMEELFPDEVADFDLENNKRALGKLRNNSLASRGGMSSVFGGRSLIPSWIKRNSLFQRNTDSLPSEFPDRMSNQPRFNFNNTSIAGDNPRFSKDSMADNPRYNPNSKVVYKIDEPEKKKKKGVPWKLLLAATAVLALVSTAIGIIIVGAPAESTESASAVAAPAPAPAPAPTPTAPVATPGGPSTETQTPFPTPLPTPEPTNYPTPEPTNYPTPEPTNYPTPEPLSQLQQYEAQCLLLYNSYGSPPSELSFCVDDGARYVRCDTSNPGSVLGGDSDGERGCSVVNCLCDDNLGVELNNPCPLIPLGTIFGCTVPSAVGR